MLAVPKNFADQKYYDQHPYEVDLAHVGQGNWRAFRALGISLQEVVQIAEGWKAVFSGITRPWLCWNVDDDWSLVQQKIIKEAGWTPVIGFDPRVGPPKTLIKEAVICDFNKELGLPVLYPHFPLEFAFLFCDRLAFWHSDLLIRKEKLAKIKEIFETLKDGETAAVRCHTGLRELFSEKDRRYWEVIGCTTRKASEKQFQNGCGWWMDYWAHPNRNDGAFIKSKYYWDHGAGIYYWHKKHGRHCITIPKDIYEEGHFTKMSRKNFTRFREDDSLSDARRNMSSELKDNLDLVQACEMLDIKEYLAA